MSNSYYPQPRSPLPPYRSVPPAYAPVPTRRRFPLLIIVFTSLIFGALALCIVGVIGSSLLSLVTSRTQFVSLPPTPVPTLPPLKVYTIVGKPTVDAQFINNVLQYYGSPASGKGQALYDDGVRAGINPAYALAFFLEESNFGTKGVATVTHALGNIRASEGEAQYKGYRSYKTWEDGFADWYNLIATKYVDEWHLSTIEQIIPVYAPGSDANDEKQYILTIKIAIERWRNGFVDI